MTVSILAHIIYRVSTSKKLLKKFKGKKVDEKPSIPISSLKDFLVLGAWTAPYMAYLYVTLYNNVEDLLRDLETLRIRGAVELTHDNEVVVVNTEVLKKMSEEEPIKTHVYGGDFLKNMYENILTQIEKESPYLTRC